MRIQTFSNRQTPLNNGIIILFMILERSVRIGLGIVALAASIDLVRLTDAQDVINTEVNQVMKKTDEKVEPPECKPCMSVVIDNCYICSQT